MDLTAETVVQFLDGHHGHRRIARGRCSQHTAHVEHAVVSEPAHEAPQPLAAPPAPQLLLLRLQRTAGNAAVGRLLSARGLRLQRDVATAPPDTAKLKADLDAQTAGPRSLR